MRATPCGRKEWRSGQFNGPTTVGHAVLDAATAAGKHGAMGRAGVYTFLRGSGAPWAPVTSTLGEGMLASARFLLEIKYKNDCTTGFSLVKCLGRSCQTHSPWSYPWMKSLSILFPKKTARNRNVLISDSCLHPLLMHRHGM